MVEGPGCKVKGEVMTKRIKGKTVTSVKVPVKNDKKILQGKSTQSGTQALDRFHKLCGLEVSDVRTLGKELFIFLSQSPVCIRIHFLMDGSARYGHITDKRKQLTDPSLIITFPDEKLFIFKSAIELRSTEKSMEHCNSLADVDICSSSFNFKRALQLVKEKQTDLICDAIMDQTVLPGVGNIIKNEGLFKSGINPNTLVSDISDNLITCLIHRLRDFSKVFYMCRKNNKPLKHHLCIYEMSKCNQCSNKVTVCKPGTLGRLTFFCCICQVNSIASTTISLPNRNSVLGFLQYCDPSNLSDWQCSLCTYINKPMLLSCEMCSAQKPGKRKRSSLEEDELKQEALAKKSKRENFSDVCSSEGGLSLTNPVSSEKCLNLNQMDMESAPLCPGHQKECIVRKVTRSTENKGRTFYCCRMPSAKQCNFFQWADLHQPLCKHGKRTIIQRVLKQNENNGREFYCCPLQKNHQCNFFQWA